MTLEYDNARIKYYSSLKVLKTPLMCWDFYSNYKNDFLLFNIIQKNWTEKIDFLKETNLNSFQILITDSKFKIIFATDNLIDMNGYQPFEVIGKSPSLFQGLETSEKTKKSIKKALNSHAPFKELILNYKKNGESYWCEIEAYPKFDNQGNFLNYIAFEKIAA